MPSIENRLGVFETRLSEMRLNTQSTVRPRIPQESLRIMQLVPKAEKALRSVISEEGLRASQDERFHHYFGRDTFISADFIHAANEFESLTDVWNKAKGGLLSFWQLQRPDGKIIHEAIRCDEMLKRKRESLYDVGDIADFYYPKDEYILNDDSIDATPLALIVTPQFVADSEELDELIPSAEKALRWMIINMDENGGFLRYQQNKLTNQGWMDSKHGVVNLDGTLPDGPIALVEVQAFVWKAFRVWSDLLAKSNVKLSSELWERAYELRMRFNETFLYEDQKGVYFAHALDGENNQVKTPSINPGVGLWANYKEETIYYRKYIPPLVRRLTDPAFFDSEAGICTFEKGQRTFDTEGYHNGENIFWPFATAMVAKGMLSMGYKEDAQKILTANFMGILHFNSFIETFSKNGQYRLFRGGGENGSCKNQTWTVAEFLWSVSYLASPTDKSS